MQCPPSHMLPAPRLPPQEPGTTYFVTLKILSNRSARSTLIPKDVPGLMAAQTTSKMLPTMTCSGGRPGPHTHSYVVCMSVRTLPSPSIHFPSAARPNEA